ncbi:MAG: TonB-dependent receptor [Bacteroidales bacterium]|nr:TonB-dependent receptor [Bacteroidales bacterium]
MNIAQHKTAVFLLFFSLMLISQAVFAQYGTVRGFVYEQESGEPVIFTNVYLQNTSYGSSTDVNGYFVISKIPAGNYLLLVTYLGFDTLKIDVSIKPDEIITRKLFLEKASYTLEQVQVTAEREEAQTETRTSVVKITPKQIKQIPTIGGQADLAQYLQVLPGVVFTGDQGGQLYIRGGSPVQNKVLLDGMIIYNPFHSIGLFSVFDTDILRNADIYTGGFGAEYGGRISSVMDITTRDGNKKRYSGKAGASTFGANLMVEGPIKKQTDNSEGSSSFILSVKNSYLEQSSETFYKYVDEDGLPFNYTDLYGKVSLLGSNGSKVNFFGFNYTDKVNDYRALSDFSWNSFGGGTNFVIIPGTSPILLEGRIAYSKYDITLNEENFPERSSSINGFNMGLDFTYFIGRDELNYGIEMLGFKTDYTFYNLVGTEISQVENTTELGVYFKYKLTAGKWLIEPSIRMHWYASLSNLSPEPRLAMKFNASDRFRMKAAMGLYSQNLISANSDRDVVNLFYGFLSGPDNLPDEFDGEDITHKLQKAGHLIFGVEYDLAKNLYVNLEGYYKNFSQLTNINRQKLYDENEYPGQPDILTKDFIVERGHAKGLDLSMKYDYNRFYFWTVYSLGYVLREYEDAKGNIREYNPHYDRRHNVNLVGTYIAGKKYDWEFTARWNFGSGFPFTLTRAFYPLISFMDGIYTDYTRVNEELGILYDDLNGGRLPTYHRLDLGIKKKFELGRYSNLEIIGSVTNVYDRENVFYRDRVTGETVYQLPIMPSLGASITF